MNTTQAGYFMSLHRPVTVEELKNAKAEEISPGRWKFPDRSVGRLLNTARGVRVHGGDVAAIYFDEESDDGG